MGQYSIVEWKQSKVAVAVESGCISHEWPKQSNVVKVVECGQRRRKWNEDHSLCRYTFGFGDAGEA